MPNILHYVFFDIIVTTMICIFFHHNMVSVMLSRRVAVAEGRSASTCSSSCWEFSSWSRQTLCCGGRPWRTLRWGDCNITRTQRALCICSSSAHTDAVISFRWRACFRNTTIAAARASKLPHAAPSRSLCLACPTLTRRVPPAPPHPATKAGL